MTKTEAQKFIAETALDFLVNPYNIARDLELNNSGTEEWDEAVAVLGGDWADTLAWETQVSCGDYKTETTIS